MAWDIVEAMRAIRRRSSRSNDEEAQWVIVETLDLIDRSLAERAYLYEFITGGSTRSNDPLYDYDLTGYGIVSTWGAGSEFPYETTGFWEPKVAFHELAAWNSGGRAHAAKVKNQRNPGEAKRTQQCDGSLTKGKRSGTLRR